MKQISNQIQSSGHGAFNVFLTKFCWHLILFHGFTCSVTDLCLEPYSIESSGAGFLRFIGFVSGTVSN